ncbi:astacin-like metalloendopeptidase isoform X3 [Emydura macquarii macquarii]|uniref:astacin-like metalloendopeptidase isoform X3 n=1 Tax=Emydura macquarii macquarii TaxID=1129001 RepID=UPI00352AB79C
MGLPCGMWPIFIGLIWVAEALLLGGRGDSLQLGNPQTNAVVAGNPPGGGGGDDDDILRINQELIPPEAPESSFLLEGDIVKASPFRLFSSASPKWPKRRGIVRIPYVLSYKYDKQSVKIIKEAFADFAAFTCIKFVPYSYQRDFISVTPMSGCFSSVGRTGGMQVVSLAPACLRKGKGVALHELMHVVGFWHEHSRADRDKYISISWNEILTGFEINFMKSWTSNMLVNYDYSSVLHYGRYAFSMTGLPTIIPLSNPYAALGQRWNLSRSDIARINKLYKCSQTGAEAGSPSTIKEDIMDVISNELEPCPTEGETKVSTTSRASSPGTNPLETAQSAKGPFKQTSAPTAGTEKPMGRTAMNDEELRVSLTTVQGLQSVKFAPTGLSTQGMTYLGATGKTPPTHTEMGTAEAEEKFLIPMEETSLLGTVSLQESDFTTVMLSPESHPSTREVTSHHGKVAEGLGITKIPTETLAGLEFPELVSPQGLLQKMGGTRPSEVGIAETTSLQGMELAYPSTYLAQKGPSPATEFRVVALTSNQTQSLETQTELATAEITSSLEGSSGTYTPVMHTAATLALGQTPPMQVSATETSHLLSTEKWTTNLPSLTSAKSVTTMAPTRARSAPMGQTPSVEMETTTVAYATEQTSLFPTTQSWTSSPTTQRNQSYAWWATTPGSQERSTIVRPLAGKAKIEPTEAMQPTSLTTSFERTETHTASLELLFPLGATTRHKKSTSLSSSGIETSSIKPPSKAIPFMETQTELGFVEATRSKASGQHGFPSLTVGTYFPVTKVKDAEYATETETLPVTWVSQVSEPAEMSMQATTANYRNKERIHTTAIRPTYTPSLGESENPITHPQNAGPAEVTRSEDQSQATLSTRSSTEMGVQEARNTSPNRRRGHTYTPASVLTSSTATELKFMERPTREASGLETAVAQASSPSEMGIAGLSSAWTEAEDQFSSSPREATLFPRSSATEKGNSTEVIQSLESASLSEVGTNKHTARYRVGAGLVTLNPPESRPRTAPVQSVEMPELTVPEKVTPVHIEPTTNQAQRGVRNTTPSLVDKMLSPQAEPTKATYPAEGPSLLQVSPQTFSPIELRLRMSRKQQMHAAISSRDNLTPPEGTPTASLSSGELQHSAKATATQASETPTMRAEEAEGRGNTFLFPTGTTMPAEKPYMKSAMGIPESQTTSTTELQTPKASLAHAEGANFPKTTPSETANTQLLGTSETHTILTWEPRSQVRPRKQLMAWFTKASPLNVSKGTTLEAPAEFRPVATMGSGMETKERCSLIERTSPPLSQAPEVTFPPETLTTNSAETGVQEAINPLGREADGLVTLLVP